uniref:Capsid protein VP1 n=1 Tax=Cacopsylla melanoneura TaxID=428564 RepID=A0A8D8QZL9_9HEMI
METKHRNEVTEALHKGLLEKAELVAERENNALKTLLQKTVKESPEKPLLKRKAFKIPSNEEFQKTQKYVIEAFRQGRLERAQKETNKNTNIENFKPVTDAIVEVKDAILGQKNNIPEILPTLALPSTSETQEHPPVIGQLLLRYFGSLNDSTFGIKHNIVTNKYTIGSETITFPGGDDFVVKGKKYTATNGLAYLLTQTTINSDDYSDEDLKHYTQILIDSNAMHHYNSPSSKKPKSGPSKKYKNIIKPIWDAYKQKQGSGFISYIPDPKEYIHDFPETKRKLQHMAAEERAGNTNYRKNKILILDIITDRLRHLIDAPEGDNETHARSSEILLSLLQCLNEHAGSGFINDLLNSKHMPELHVPSYNYLGPGTKLDEKIKNNVKPINRLDEAAKEHDIFYDKHKDTKERHIADKKLQEKAWEIAVDPKTPLNEKAVAYMTTSAMAIKRKMGMGLI